MFLPGNGKKFQDAPTKNNAENLKDLKDKI